MSANELRVNGIVKSYPTFSGPLPVLTNVSLHLSAGQSAAIVGPSGSGKTTLLQILGTLDTPDEGELRINGEDPISLNENERADFRNRAIGFIFQDHHLLPQLTVTENVLVPTLAKGKPSRQQIDYAAELIASVGLSDRRTHLPAQLSGGERERVAIARALLMRPALLLADEPTGNLDARTAAIVTDLLLRLQAETQTVLVTVTHSMTLAAAMNQQHELVDGKLIQRSPNRTH